MVVSYAWGKALFKYVRRGSPWCLSSFGSTKSHIFKYHCSYTKGGLSTSVRILNSSLATRSIDSSQSTPCAISNLRPLEWPSLQMNSLLEHVKVRFHSWYRRWLLHSRWAPHLVRIKFQTLLSLDALSLSETHWADLMHQQSKASTRHPSWSQCLYWSLTIQFWWLLQAFSGWRHAAYLTW